MKIARLAGLMFVAIMAMSLVAVSAASATEPLFNPASGQSLTGTSGSAKLSANNGVETVNCEKSSSTGTVTSSLLVGNIVVHFLGCVSSSASKSNCTVKSTNSPAEGLILTTTLHGILGLILPSKETGLLLLPVSGKRFVTLASNACTIETAVTGSVAGLIEPLGKKQLTGKLILAANGSNQAIEEIDLTHGLGSVKPALNAFTSTATETVSEAITFGVETEVT
jgi:hypothetical protein